jgi:Leucine-rich repeat (LRR) protein
MSPQIVVAAVPAAHMNIENPHSAAPTLATHPQHLFEGEPKNMTTVHKNRTAAGATTRRQRRERKPLLSVLRGTDAAIDLASIMAGVLVVGIIGGVISASVFAVIPWSHDNAAKADLQAIHTAEAVYQTTHNSFGSLNDLHTATTISSAGGSGGPGQPGASVAADITSTPLLPDSSLPTVITNSDAGYIAAVTSQSGVTFFLSNLSPTTTSDPAAVVVPDGLTVPVPDPATTAAWNIPDPALRNIVLWTLGKSQTDTLTIGDAANLTSLGTGSTVSGTVDPSWGPAFSVATELRSVRDLTGLEAATNLTSLTLRNSQVSDLAPISGLPLTTLDLDGTAVADSDLAPISGLPLTDLNLSNTPVTDLAPIAGLVALTDLSFGGDQISDLSPLTGMGQLTNLNAQGGKFTDLSPLSGLKNLRSLSMDNSQVTNLTPLHDLTGLHVLEVSNTPLTSLAGVEGLTGLQILSAGSTGVSDLTPLTGLAGLVSLQLNFTAVSDLTPIAGLRNVGDLEIHGTQVHDLTPLAGWPVGLLGASGTSITDWSPVAGWSVYK